MLRIYFHKVKTRLGWAQVLTYKFLMEEKYLSGNRADHKFGQVLGFIVALLMIACGTFLIFTGYFIAGSIRTGTTALGVIGLFANNSKNN